MGRGTTIGGNANQNRIRNTNNNNDNNRATGTTTIGSSLGTFSNPFRSGGVAIGGDSTTGVFTNYDHLEKNNQNVTRNATTEASF